MLVVQSFASHGAPTPSSEVTAATQRILDSYQLAGVASVIADKSGKVHYENILGWADVVANRPMSEHHLLWIASMTKMFTDASKPIGKTQPIWV